MTNDSYLERLTLRRLANATKRQIVFGLVLGWFLLGMGTFRYYFDMGIGEVSGKEDQVGISHLDKARRDRLKSDRFYLKVMAWGAGLIVVATLAPTLLAPAERAFRGTTQWIGKGIFSILLMIVYFLIVWPSAIVLRRLRGATGICKWGRRGPGQTARWQPKFLPEEVIGKQVRRNRKRFIAAEPFRVVSFFLRQRHYILIPGVIVLLILGIALFFISASAFAPFIYTLF